MGRFLAVQCHEHPHTEHRGLNELSVTLGTPRTAIAPFCTIACNLSPSLLQPFPS